MGAWPIPSSNAETSLPRGNIMKQCGPGELVKLYEKKYELAQNEAFPSIAEKRSYTIFRYIKACSEGVHEAEELLKRNGFSFKTISDPIEIEKINKQYRQSKLLWSKRYPDYKIEHYDQIVSGYRGPSWRKPWLNLNSTRYTTSIFLLNGEIKWAYGYIDSTLP